MQTDPAIEQNRNVSQIVRGISPLGEGKVYAGKDLPKSQVLSSE